MIHEILGSDIDKYNSELGNIDLSDLLPKSGTTKLNYAGPRPRALVPFLEKHHKHAKNVRNHWLLQTKPEASCYIRHGDIIRHNTELFDIGAAVKSGNFGDCQPDFSQITTGNRAYYLTCAPNELRCQAEFFTAYAAELATQDPYKPGLIVDMHTHVPKLTDDYLTEEPPNGLTDLEEVETIRLGVVSQDGEMSIQIRKAEIDGKEFFHLRILHWPDNAALNPEIVSKINEHIEDLCARYGIQKMTTHCNGGLGRAPTMMYANSVEHVAREANARGMGCCCDWDNQTSPTVGDRVNLAFVMRNMMLTGHAIRSTCGQSAEQFEFYKDFTEKMAEKYASPTPA
jgi:hypothetical protein